MKYIKHSDYTTPQLCAHSRYIHPSIQTLCIFILQYTVIYGNHYYRNVLLVVVTVFRAVENSRSLVACVAGTEIYRTVASDITRNILLLAFHQLIMLVFLGPRHSWKYIFNSKSLFSEKDLDVRLLSVSDILSFLSKNFNNLDFGSAIKKRVKSIDNMLNFKIQMSFICKL